MRSDHHVARRWSPWVGKPPPATAAPVVQPAPLPVIATKPATRKTRPTAIVLRPPWAAPAAVAAALPVAPLVTRSAPTRRRTLALVLPRIEAGQAPPPVPVMEGARPVRRSDFHYAPIRKRTRKARENAPPTPPAKAPAPPPRARLVESLARATQEAQDARRRADEAIALAVDLAQYKAAREAQRAAVIAEQRLAEELLLLELIE